MRITIIGSGNVATQLGAAFKNAGHHIVQIYSRTMQNAALLAYYISAEPIDDLNLVNPETDIFIISVKDDVIESIAQTLAKHQRLMVHTSGATELSLLLSFTANAGVIYPLQTLSKNKEIDFITVPLCIEGADGKIAFEVEQLAQTVSNYVYRVNSGQRKILHLAAVFACNFSNYLYTIAQQLLEKHDMDFELLRPLILETAQKVQDQLPYAMQTGPASRKDEGTMAAHLQMLSKEPEMSKLYEVLSQAIIKNDNDKHTGS